MLRLPGSAPRPSLGLTVYPALPSRCILRQFGCYFFSKSDWNVS